MASQALVLCIPAGYQETIFRAASWDLAKPLPEGWQISPQQPRRAAEQGDDTVPLPARAGRLTTRPRSVERRAGRRAAPPA